MIISNHLWLAGSIPPYGHFDDTLWYLNPYLMGFVVCCVLYFSKHLAEFWE